MPFNLVFSRHSALATRRRSPSSSPLLSTGGSAVLRAALVVLAVLLAPAPAAAQSGLEYRIGPEDVLHISVWKEDDLDRKVLVRPDGGISFPLAGDLQVSGRTPLEVQDEIRSRLQRYVPDAEVTVAVDEISGYTVFVLGEVNTPGQFTLGRYVDVVQALTLAGGLTPYANERSIQVLRRQDGQEVTYGFDYRDIQRGRDLKQNIILQSGDVVVVP